MTVDEVVETVLDHAAALGATAGALAVMGEGELFIRGRFDYRRGVDGEVHEMHVQPGGMLHTAFASDRIVVQTPEAEADGASPTLGLPLRAGDHNQGALLLQLADAQLPSAARKDFYMLLGQQVGVALHRARLYEEARFQAAFEQRLLAVIGHDLRTPLSAIMMAAELLPQQDEHTAGLVQRIARSAERMGELIASVMLLAADRNQRAASQLATEIDVALADQVQELRAAYPQREILFTPGATAAEFLHMPRINQAVANLVRNALQHGAAGTPVTVRSQVSDGRLEVRVENEGTPISAEDLPRLFDPFQRGNAASGDGIGLGLYIVADIMKRIGGHVEATSDDTKTAFILHVPLLGDAGVLS